LKLLLDRIAASKADSEKEEAHRAPTQRSGEDSSAYHEEQIRKLEA
jgi:hypothetical protein